MVWGGVKGVWCDSIGVLVPGVGRESAGPTPSP